MLNRRTTPLSTCSLSAAEGVNKTRRNLRTGMLSLVGAAVALTVAAGPAAAHTPKPAPLPALTGTTSVTTAPGLAATLLKAGIAPLAKPGGTTLSVGTTDGLSLTYGFPITRGNPNLAAGTGDILHAGGIDFVSRKARISVGKFDIDLKAGKIFATRVNGKTARVALLDLDLSKLTVANTKSATTLSGITVRLDGAGATALNGTFETALPTDGSLAFGSAVVAIKA